MNTNHDILTRIIGLRRFSKDQGFLNEISGIEREFKNAIERRWSFIMLHHSLTADGETVSWGAIRKWHMGLHPDSPYREKPMVDIGYHYGIEQIGDQYEILVGRDLDHDGAHCPQGEMNRKAIGICFVGNFDLASPPANQWARGLLFVKSLMRILDIPIIVGHRDYNPDKSCPGKMFDMEKFRKDIARMQ